MDDVTLTLEDYDVMKKYILPMAALMTTVSGLAFASDATGLKDKITTSLSNATGINQSLWEVGGHVEAGMYANQYWQRNRYDSGGWGSNFDSESGNTSLLNNVRHADPQINQAWVYFGKKLDTRKGFDLGCRADFVWGTDAVALQSAGLEKGRYEYNSPTPWGHGDYYSALAQLYLEAGYDIYSLKAGKFIAPMGLTSPMSTERFFYSTPYASLILPGTQSGVVATVTPKDNLSVFAGWTSGQTSPAGGLPFAAMTFDTSDSNAALFGAKYDFNSKVSLAYTGLYGEQKHYTYYSPTPPRDPEFSYYVHSLMLNVKPAEKWRYAAEWTYLEADDGWGTGDTYYYKAFGINQEVFYKLTDQWEVGGRFEWMKIRDDSSSLVDHDRANMYAFTVGANWTPLEWLIVKPEIRYDVVNGQDNWRPFNLAKSNWNHGKDTQLSGGLSLIAKF